MFWKYDARNWLQYTCVGTQFTLTFCLGVGGGIWLDGKQGTMPGYTITGAVLGAVPPAAGKFPVDKNDLTCPENQPKKVVAAPKLPTTMDQGLVKALMDMVNADLGACYEMFGKAGDVPVDVVVAPSGKVKIAKVAGDLSGTPTAECVERMVKNLTFPKFVGRDARLQWPFTLK